MTATTTTATTAATTPITNSLRWLYVIQAGQLVLPLLSVPYLARVLGPGPWGRVAAAQAFAMLAGLVVEFGFNISGSRRVARCAGSQAGLRRAFSALLTAQLFLLAVVCLLVMLARPWIPFLMDDPALAAAALIWMVPQAMSLQWYFQGREQMPILAAWIFLGRLAGLAGLVTFVRQPSDASLSLAVPGLCGIAALIAAAWEPVRQLRPGVASPGEVASIIRQGAGLFAYRAGLALQGAGNTVLLGWMLAPVALGAFAGAERLSRAALGLLEPLLVTLFPRMTMLHARGQAAAERQEFDRLSFLRICGMGLAIALALGLGAPWLTGLLLGAGYEETIPVLRAFALWPLANALVQFRGLGGLAARGRDRELTLCLLGGALAQVCGLLALGIAQPAGLTVWTAAWMTMAQFLLWLWLERVAAE